ncbi:MAG: FemAB family XrtA/PEP-CTERM system-associated protein [Planctomycetota bacterium]
MTGRSDALEVRAAREDEREEWDAFVEATPHATFFHLSSWARAVTEEFGHADRGLVARRDGEVVGVLPLIGCRGLRGGRSLISSAYAVYGGPVGVDAEVERALFEEADRIAVAERARRLELRCLHDPGFDLPRSDLYATFIKDLPERAEDVLPGMPKKARADARKARKNHGLTLNEGPWYVADLVRLFHRNKRSLGSPALPAGFFARLLSTFPGASTVHVVKDGDEPVAAVMSFLFRDTVLAYYSGTADGADRRVKASAFMYMALQEWCVERGYRVFDFGRSRRGAGAFKFKEHQGFEARDLHYLFRLVRDEHLPSLNPSNPKTLVLQRTWRRLPLGVTGVLARSASRYLP